MPMNVYFTSLLLTEYEKNNLRFFRAYPQILSFSEPKNPLSKPRSDKKNCHEGVRKRWMYLFVNNIVKQV